MKNRIKLLNKYFKKLEGKEIKEAQDLIDETINETLQRAKPLLSVFDDEVSMPLIIVTPDTLNDEKIYFRLTKNKESDNFRVDFSRAITTTIFINETHLLYHKAIVDVINNKVLFDLTGEVSLLDIVNIETELSYQTLKKTTLSNLLLTLNLIDGSEVAFSLRSEYVSKDLEQPELLREDEAYVIETIKQAVRLAK